MITLPSYYFEELLSPLGKVEISREITDEARQPLRGSQKSKVKSQK